MGQKEEVRLQLCQRDCIHGVGDPPEIKVSMAFLNFIAHLMKIGNAHEKSGWEGDLPGDITLWVKGDRSHQGTTVTLRGPARKANIEFVLPTCFGSTLESTGETVADGITVCIQGACAYALTELRMVLKQHYPELLAGLDNGDILLDE
jgi:hypothetical protein